jgi:hypothetical protein
MLRKTTKILAVAVAVTAAACGGTAGAVSPEPTRQELADELARTPLPDAVGRSDHFRPLCDGQGYPLPGNINGKGTPTTVGEFCGAIGKGEPTPTPTPTPTACDKDALNVALSDQPLESAVADHGKYRCLCDDKGYPLVGNINGKGTKVSLFCKALAEKGLL